MKYRKKILTVGVTGALLLNISGAVSPLNNTLADAQGTATTNTDQELQKAKEEAIKKLEEYNYLFDKKIFGVLSENIKKAKIKEIEEAKSKEKVKEIIDGAKSIHELNKTKEESKDFLETLKYVQKEHKNEIRTKIGNAKNINETIGYVKDGLKKELDGYTGAFNKDLYGEAVVEQMKNEMKRKIHDESKTIEDLKKILTTVKTADEIGKAKEEGRQKVDKMTNLSPEQKREAYNSIGSGSTLEEVKREEKKAEEKEEQEKAKKENAGNEQNNPPQDNGSVQQPKEKEQGDQPSAPNGKEKEELELYKQQAKEELTKKGIKNTSLIETATTKSGVDTIKNMLLKNHLETYKNKAKETIKNLKGLEDDEKVQYKEQIDIADSESEVDEIVTTAKTIIEEKEKAKKRQAEANAELEKIKDYVKKAAKEQIEKLNNLSQAQKAPLLKEVETNTDVKDLEKVYKNAKTFDTKVKEAKEQIEKLADLNATDKKTYKEKIEKSENVEKVNENLGLAIEKNRQILETAKTKALDELKKLMNLTDDQLQKAKAEVLAGQDKKSVENSLSDAKVLDNKELTEARAKAKEEIEKLKDLKPEEKTKANSDITNSVTKKVINEVVEKAKKQDAKNKAEKVKPNEKPSGDDPQTPTPMPENPGENQTPQTPTPMPENPGENQTPQTPTPMPENPGENQTPQTPAPMPENPGENQTPQTPTPMPENPGENQTPQTPAPMPENPGENQNPQTPTPMPENPGENQNPQTPAPEVKAGWKKDDAGTKYQKENGSFAKAEWEPVNGTWYHFDENGYMQTGWLNLDGTWYYLNDDGSMAKDTWIGTYYVDESGAWVIEGWKNSGYGWWYQRANGTYPHSEWEIINGIWYYFDANGYMLADTTTPDGYYVDANGAWVN